MNRHEELQAGTASADNCDLFRARIAELEEKLAVDDDANFNLRGLLQRGAFALGLDPENTSWFEVIGGLEQLRAELADLKAQEPVAWVGTIEDGVPLLVVEPQNWKATPLYAAPVSEATIDSLVDELRIDAEALGLSVEVVPVDTPVSEAKAQGVVMPTVDQAMRVVLREMGSSKHIRGTSNWCADVGRAVLDEVARLNAAPAAPAADAPPENCRQRLAYEGKPYPKSSCAACGQFSPKWRECDAALSAHRSTGVV